MNRDLEHVRGIAEPLPHGERMLWQGAPDWRGLARHAFHVRKVAIYFAALVVWRVAAAIADGEALAAAAGPVLWLAALGALAIGVLALLAWATAQTTTYAITSRRVVMRVGVALPMTVNLPLQQIAAANLLARRDGSGDIALALMGNVRIAWLHLWPHVRAWRLARPEPTLRAVPDARRIAALLADAARAASRRPALADVTAPEPARSLAAAAN